MLSNQPFDHRHRLALAAVVLVALAMPAAAQTARNLKIVVPYPPASGPDILTRLMADQIGRAQNATVVVENRPGGGTTIGTEAVARAAPDGGTVLLVANSFVVNPALKKGNYDVAGSFEPVCQLAATPIVLVVKGDSPFKTIADLIAAARARPGELSVGGAPASSLQMAHEVLKRGANISMTYVPFGGTAPAVNTLMGGHVTAVSADYPTVVGHIKSGTLRPLVTAGAKRVETMPDVPTFAEAGLGKYEDEIFYGYMAPAKTPSDATKQLGGWFSEAMSAAEVKPKLAQQGLFTSIKCGADFAGYLHNMIDQYGRIIREANIKAE
jgi:tripartite-type tricarboxylate transporter receptor subunit TctC